MAKSVFDAPQFKTEEGAFAYVEAHLWPNGPVCPHCGNCDEARIRKMQGKTTRMGLYKCNECRKPFTVRMGTIFESSHLALHLWLQVIHLMCASKKGISTRQIQRMLSCSMKTAWFLTHRIREAMRNHKTWPMGGLGATVEADETFIGREPGTEVNFGYLHRMKVVSLVDRVTGQARSFVVDHVSSAEIAPIVFANVRRETKLMTDEHRVYRWIGKHYYRHETKDSSPSSNGGIYQHCQKKHLHRYLAEFDFRFPLQQPREAEISDTMRAQIALRGFVGKRLTYETTGRAN